MPQEARRGGYSGAFAQRRLTKRSRELRKAEVRLRRIPLLRTWVHKRWAQPPSARCRSQLMAAAAPEFRTEMCPSSGYSRSSADGQWRASHSP